MADGQLSKLLDELMEKIEDGPGSHTDILSQIVKKLLLDSNMDDQLYTALRNLQEAIAKLDESLGVIRLVIKYLVFDLEATRRERDQFRMRLEDQE